MEEFGRGVMKGKNIKTEEAQELWGHGVSSITGQGGKVPKDSVRWKDSKSYATILSDWEGMTS